MQFSDRCSGCSLLSVFVHHLNNFLFNHCFKYITDSNNLLVISLLGELTAWTTYPTESDDLSKEYTNL